MKPPHSSSLTTSAIPFSTHGYINTHFPSRLYSFSSFLPFILTLFGWLRSSRRLTTDWSLHCTARRNNPFNGLRVIDRRILWHQSFRGHLYFLFIRSWAICSRVEKRSSFFNLSMTSSVDDTSNSRLFSTCCVQGNACYCNV